MSVIHSVLAACTSSKWPVPPCLVGQWAVLVTFHVRLLIGSSRFLPYGLVMRNDHIDFNTFIY